LKIDFVRSRSAKHMEFKHAWDVAMYPKPSPPLT
jgi:hypothetical protein